MKITFDKSAAKAILDLLGIKDVDPENFAGIVNGKVYTKDLPSLIEMSDAIHHPIGSPKEDLIK